ncbi:MAG: hypothetical protein RL375_3671 [Pseudomonadota bacterium]
MSAHIAVIDRSLANHAAVLAGFAPDTEVLMIDAAEDGWRQLAERLSGRSDIGALDIYGRVAVGEVTLGSGVLDITHLPDYTTLLAQIGRHLAPGASVLLHGCDPADTSFAQSVFDQLT